MTGTDRPAPGDRARASVLVKVDRAEAFRLFTEEIDLWWRRGPRFRVAGHGSGIIRLESGVGGRLYETIETGEGSRIVHSGTVIRWEPPSSLAFEWHAVNFAAGEKTLVEVGFEEVRGGTFVTVVHGGWSRIRPDHPVRHGLDVPAFVRMIGIWWGDHLTSLRQRTLPRPSPRHKGREWPDRDPGPAGTTDGPAH